MWGRLPPFGFVENCLKIKNCPLAKLNDFTDSFFKHFSLVCKERC